MRTVALAAAATLLTLSSLVAQEPVISRGETLTLTGEIVEISCYKRRGVAEGTGPDHVACAKECVTTKNGAVGILSDGDGLFRLWGAYAKDKYARLVPYIGQKVETIGAEVVLSNNYDVRSFDVQKIAPLKKTR